METLYENRIFKIEKNGCYCFTVKNMMYIKIHKSEKFKLGFVGEELQLYFYIYINLKIIDFYFQTPKWLRYLLLRRIRNKKDKYIELDEYGGFKK